MAADGRPRSVWSGRAPHSGRGSGYPRKEGGFILVTLLLIISLLVPIVIGFYAKTQINLLQAANFRDTIQAVRMARSGVEVAIAVLKADSDSYDGLTDKWAAAFPALMIGDEKVEITVIDEDRKLNVNKLVGEDGKVDAGLAARMKALVKRLGGKEEIVNALIDWIDSDDVMTDPGGAEAEYYRDRGYPPKNGPLDSLDELLMIKGFDKDLLVGRGLMSFLTVAPTDGKVNLNTAPPELLYDLGAGGTSPSAGQGQPPKTGSGGETVSGEAVSENLVAAIIAQRTREPFKTMEEVNHLPEMGLDPPAAVTDQKVNSSLFLVRVTCRLGKVQKDVSAVLKREKGAVTIMSWRES